MAVCSWSSSAECSSFARKSTRLASPVLPAASLRYLFCCDRVASMSSISTSSKTWQVGVARRIITPGNHVELAGLGYYLQRTPTSVRDNLTATAMVIEDAAGKAVALIAFDIMYGDDNFTKAIRDQICRQTDLRPEGICVNCSHSHNAPNAASV